MTDALIVFILTGLLVPLAYWIAYQRAYQQGGRAGVNHAIREMATPSLIAKAVVHMEDCADCGPEYGKHLVSQRADYRSRQWGENWHHHH